MRGVEKNIEYKLFELQERVQKLEKSNLVNAYFACAALTLAIFSFLAVIGWR